MFDPCCEEAVCVLEIGKLWSGVAAIVATFAFFSNISNYESQVCCVIPKAQRPSVQYRCPAFYCFARPPGISLGRPYTPQPDRPSKAPSFVNRSRDSTSASYPFIELRELAAARVRAPISGYQETFTRFEQDPCDRVLAGLEPLLAGIWSSCGVGHIGLEIESWAKDYADDLPVGAEKRSAKPMEDAMTCVHSVESVSDSCLGGLLRKETFKMQHQDQALVKSSSKGDERMSLSSKKSESKTDDLFKRLSVDAAAAFAAAIAVSPVMTLIDRLVAFPLSSQNRKLTMPVGPSQNPPQATPPSPTRSKNPSNPWSGIHRLSSSTGQWPPCSSCTA